MQPYLISSRSENTPQNFLHNGGKILGLLAQWQAHMPGSSPCLKVTMEDFRMKRLFLTLAALSILAPAIPVLADEPAPAGGSAPAAGGSSGSAPPKKLHGLRKRRAARKAAKQAAPASK